LADAPGVRDVVDKGVDLSTYLFAGSPHGRRYNEPRSPLVSIVGLAAFQIRDTGGVILHALADAACKKTGRTKRAERDEADDDDVLDEICTPRISRDGRAAIASLRA
jgi:hypothetical protein